MTVESPQDAGVKSWVTASLQILATSDLHAYLAAHDYAMDCASTHTGLVRTATLIEQARLSAPASILIDNGDFLQGSPLGDHAAMHGNQIQPGNQTHPVIAAMNHLRYDAVNLGNHEFSHGLDVLEQALAHAEFPCLSANTLPGPAPEHRAAAKKFWTAAMSAGSHRRAASADPIQSPALPGLRPWVIIERQLTGSDGISRPCHIGVIGVLPPETQIWDRVAIAGRVHMTAMTEALSQHLPDLQKAGAEVIVLLAHCGFGSPAEQPDGEDGALRMSQLPGIDAVVMGHIHMAFPGPDVRAMPGVDPVLGTVGGKPAVMPGFYGSHLGQIDLQLAHDGSRWRVIGHQAQLHPIAHRRGDGVMRPLAKPDPELTRLIAPAHRAARAWARLPIGRSDAPIHSYFSLISDTPVLQLINRAQTEYVRKRLQGSALSHLPVLSAAAPFRAGGRGGPENFTSIPAGNLLLRHAADIYGHPNTIMALRLTGRDLRDWLARSAQGYRQIQPGQHDQPLLEPSAPSFLFDTISGIDYEIDLSLPPDAAAGARISQLTWQGQPITADQEFILATNSYRGSGSGGIAPVGVNQIVLAEPVQNRDILVSYLGQSAPYHPGPAAWRFRAMPGTSVVFDSAIGAISHLCDCPALTLTPLERKPDGFYTLRLSL